MKVLLPWLLPTLMLTGCAAPSIPPDTVDVFRSLEHRQCEGGGLTLQVLQDSLEQAGVRPQAAHCGDSGRMYIAVCGAEDGRIGLFTIATTDLPRAQALGFQPAPDTVRRTDCR